MKATINAYILPLVFLFCLPAAGQLNELYSFQKDDSVLKQSYYKQTLKKKEFLLSSIKENKKDYTEIYNDQFEAIAKLLNSSRSVTEPQVHGYLQSVLKKIISANADLSGLELRVVFSRDWWPNAYSMGEGTIAINAGLMVFLENEAQLVFILCHELAHYYLDHSNIAIKKYVETVNSKAFQDELKRLSKQQYRVNQQLENLATLQLFNTRKHSRDKEAEADRYAFKFMKRTGYDCGAIKTTLKLLDNIDDSLLFKPLSIPELFNFSEYPFKKKWIEKESSIFSQLSKDDTPLSKKERDSLKTHPDCEKRIALLEDSIASIQPPGKNFQVDENIFHKLKKDFLIEITEHEFKEKNLSRNLYYSLSLLQAGEKVPLAVYSVARCLNEIYENQKNHQLGTTVDVENRRYSEDYNNLLRMINKLKLDEIANLNYYFCKSHVSKMNDNKDFLTEAKKTVKLKN